MPSRSLVSVSWKFSESFILFYFFGSLMLYMFLMKCLGVEWVFFYPLCWARSTVITWHVLHFVCCVCLQVLLGLLLPRESLFSSLSSIFVSVFWLGASLGSGHLGWLLYSKLGDLQQVGSWAWVELVARKLYWVVLWLSPWASQIA